MHVSGRFVYDSMNDSISSTANLKRSLVSKFNFTFLAYTLEKMENRGSREYIFRYPHNPKLDHRFVTDMSLL